MKIPITEIAPYQGDTGRLNPRTRGKSSIPIEDLVSSMAEVGMVQPIHVVANPSVNGNGAAPKYYIVDGERRWRAALSLKWKEVPCDVVQAPADQPFGKWLLRYMVVSAVRVDFAPSALGQTYLEMAKDGYGTMELSRLTGKKVTEIDLLLALTSADPKVQASVDRFYSTGGNTGLSLSAWKMLYSRPEAVQKAAADKAETAKVTVSQAKELVKEDKERGRLDDMLQHMDTDTTVQSFLRATRAIAGSWSALPEWQRMRVYSSAVELVALKKGAK